MEHCIFCKIIKGEMPGTIVYQDEQVTAFRDVRPVAPVHILVVPNKHIATVNDATEGDEQLLGHMLGVVRLITEKEGIKETGYRLIINNGPDGNQVVYHLHMHIIGGQRMRHPMG